MNKAAGEQPLPKGKGRAVGPLVIEDIQARLKKGEGTYGEELKTFNGRDGMLDLYQELLDSCLYIRQVMEENRATKVLWYLTEAVVEFGAPMINVGKYRVCLYCKDTSGWHSDSCLWYRLKKLVEGEHDE